MSTTAKASKKRPNPIGAAKKAAARTSKEREVASATPVNPADVPYDGTLALAELETAGGLLFAYLMGRKSQLGHTMEEMAQYLGVSAGHLQLLRSGGRELEKMESQLLDRISAYLGVPRGHLMMMAGKIRPEDFDVVPLEEKIAAAITDIISDPTWGALAPKSLKSASTDLKRMIVLLYEKATGRKLIPELQDIGEHFANVQAVQRMARDRLAGAAGKRN